MSQASTTAVSEDLGVPHRTEIHFACAKGSVEEVLALLARGAPVDEEDYDRRTPIHVASASGFLDVLKALVEKGGNIFAEDRWGRTPIEDAKMGYHLEVVKYLENQGAQSKSKAVMRKNSATKDTQGLASRQIQAIPEDVSLEAGSLTSPKVVSVASISKETWGELHQRGIREMWSWNVDDFVTEDFPFAKGSGGEVYRAQFRRTDCVAKTLGRIQATDKGMDDLANEIRLMALIRHPNIITFFGACFQSSPPVMILEYCKHGTLDTAITRAYSGEEYLTFSVVQKLSYAHQIASAMTFLHEFHVPIIHRDLTPTNILVASKDVLKITDFGLAKSVPRETQPSEAVMMTGGTGSYRYMAPEVFENREYDQSVDVYSYAMIIYWLFSGIKAFHNAPDGLAAVKAASSGQRPSLKLMRDYRIQELVEQCWDQEPLRRPTFDSVCYLLDEITLFNPTIPSSRRAGGSRATNSHRPQAPLKAQPQGSDKASTAEKPKSDAASKIDPGSSKKKSSGFMSKIFG